jgi:hypothetical protein
VCRFEQIWPGLCSIMVWLGTYDSGPGAARGRASYRESGRILNGFNLTRLRQAS